MIENWKNEKLIEFTINKVLYNQIFNRDYKEIQILYEEAKITNRQLVFALHEGAYKPDTIKGNVFSSIMTILTQRIYQDHNIRQIFERLFFSKYEKAVVYAKKIIEQKGVHSTDEVKVFAKMTMSEQSMVQYYTASSGILLSEDENFLFFSDVDEIVEYQTRFGILISENFVAIMRSYVFTDTDESVLDSAVFKKFLQKRREELALLLNCKEKNLGETIISNLRKTSVNQNGQYVKCIPEHIEGVTTLISRIITAGHGCGSFWIDNAIRKSAVGDGLDSFGYLPDIDKIIYYYCAGLVIEKIYECERKEENFSKIMLSRYTVTHFDEQDLRTIYWMCCLDIVSYIIEKITEFSFESFSWEKITGVSEIDFYRKKADDLEIQNQKLTDSMNDYQEKYFLQTRSLLESADKDSYEFRKENDRLTKTIESKDKEIEELRKQLLLKDEFISFLQTEETEDYEEVDYSSLQMLKFLFVGHSKEAVPELRKLFPNSIFMETETMNLSGVDVDAVVMLTKWMSHSMFYKVKSLQTLSMLPMIMCNTKNINRILYDMYQQLH